jgi:hypothetical protein
MKRLLTGLMLLCGMVLSFSACKKTNDNAQHIPKDATAVVTVNMSSIGKKLAWDMLFNSDLFKKMSRQSGDSSTMEDLQNAGIDFMGVFYAYVAPDQRYSGGQRTVALIPLSDDGKWEAYIKKEFPQAKIKTADKRKEALLSSELYAGWDGDLLILMNTVTQGEMTMSEDGSFTPPATDEVQTAAQMDNAFKMTKENSVADNAHFAKLNKEGHDIGVWVNYENIMSNYGKGMMGGLSMSSTMMKGAVLTSGFDFEKGAIKGDVKYYVSEDLKAVMKDLVKGNNDKEMIQRLPANQLAMLTAMKFSPKALKDMLDKMGMLGLINVGLAEQKLTSDDLFGAFSGDIAFSMNNFRLEQKKYGYTYYDDNMEMHTDSSTSNDPAMDWVYVMKIDDQQKFDKIMNLATTMGGLQAAGNGVYTMQNGGERSPVIIVRDKFLVAANTTPAAEAYISGANKGQKLPEAAEKAVFEHPMGMFIDIKTMLAGIGTETIGNAKDAAQYAEVKKLLDNVVMSGGEFKDDAFGYEMSVNFLNKDENSLLQLIKMANAMSDIDERPEVAGLSH